MPPSVLDASALLALLHGEPGAQRVVAATAGAVTSAVNLVEVISSSPVPARRGRELERLGVLGGWLTVEPFTVADALEVVRLRPLTRAEGLSLADRACLALARRTERGFLRPDLWPLATSHDGRLEGAMRPCGVLRRDRPRSRVRRAR